jgi:hypothetical protein
MGSRERLPAEDDRRGQRRISSLAGAVGDGGTGLSIGLEPPRAAPFVRPDGGRRPRPAVARAAAERRLRDKIRDWEALVSLATTGFFRGGSVVPTLGFVVDPVKF